MKGARPAADWPQIRRMNKELIEKIEKLNKDSKDIESDIESLREVINMFSSTTEAENNALISAVGEKLADVFTIDVLKGMDQHFVTTETFNLLVFANTVSSYEIIGAFQTVNDDDLPPLIVLMFSLELCDGSEIIIINVQEDMNETN